MQLEHHSPMLQNLASSGIIFPIYYYLLYITSPDPVMWVRIITHTTGAIVSALILWSTIGFIQDRKIGFRWLHSLAAAFWGGRTFVHIWLAMTYLVGAGRPPVWITVAANGSEVIFGLFYYMSRKDLALTYRSSEAARQHMLDQIDGALQKAVLVNAYAQLLSEKGLEVTEHIRNVGRGSK